MCTGMPHKSLWRWRAWPWHATEQGFWNLPSLAQVMLRVTDLDKSIKYYTEALGMQLLKKKDNKDYKYTLAFLAYGPEEENVVFELTYNW